MRRAPCCFSKRLRCWWLFWLFWILEVGQQAIPPTFHVISDMYVGDTEQLVRVNVCFRAVHVFINHTSATKMIQPMHPCRGSLHTRDMRLLF